MYQVTMEVRIKKDLTRKQTYEKTAKLIRKFIDRNDKGLKEEHYLEKRFSYYTFSNFFPLEMSGRYPKGNIYTVELRSLHREFLDMKFYKAMETDELEMVDASAGKLFYLPKGKLQSETPFFFRTKRIQTKEYEEEVKEDIRENILFRYLESGINSSSDVPYLRENLVKDISIDPTVITIPFEGTKLNNGQSLLYHCVRVEIEFFDNPYAKEAEKIVYCSGAGKNTSNGFGMMKEA